MTVDAGMLQKGRTVAWRIFLNCLGSKSLIVHMVKDFGLPPSLWECLSASIGRELQLAFVAGAVVPGRLQFCLSMPLTSKWAAAEAKVDCKPPNLSQLLQSGAATPAAVQQWLAAFKLQLAPGKATSKADPAL